MGCAQCRSHAAYPPRTGCGRHRAGSLQRRLHRPSGPGPIRRTRQSHVPGASGGQAPAGGPRHEPRNVGTSCHGTQCGPDCGRWGSGAGGGVWPAGLRRNRRWPDAGAGADPGSAGGSLHSQGAGRRAGAGHCRPDFRADRPRAWHYQSLQRQDGVCHCRSSRAGRRAGHAGGWPCAAPDTGGRTAGSGADSPADARCRAGPCTGAGCLRCHGSRGRLAPCHVFRHQDQEGSPGPGPDPALRGESRHSGHHRPKPSGKGRAPVLCGICRREP